MILAERYIVESNKPHYTSIMMMILYVHIGAEYKGCEFYKGICGVSIVRSGK